MSSRKQWLYFLTMMTATVAFTTAIGSADAQQTKLGPPGQTQLQAKAKRITQAQRNAAAARIQPALKAAQTAGTISPTPLTATTSTLMAMPMPGCTPMVPDYFGAANWANSPPLKKFVDRLPGLTPAGANALGQYIPIAEPDKTTYAGSDYYEIAVVEYQEQMHSDLPPTRLRGYVQISTAQVPGQHIALTNPDGSAILLPDGTQAYAVDKPHYLGPAIIATGAKPGEAGVPTRIKFYNLLPAGQGGNLFIPVDETVMGAGMTPDGVGTYAQNRATVHLHGSNSVWISDGTPHQWITPAGETTNYPKGVSVVPVPDMWFDAQGHTVPAGTPGATNDPGKGAMTFFYTNALSARLMFYHDHAYGITRLNVYAGEAAAFLVTDQVEQDLINGTNNSGVNPGGLQALPDFGTPLVIQDRTYVDANTIGTTDPTWLDSCQATFGTMPGMAMTGDLWYPHVYMPAQNPYSEDGANPFGRWMYGPWFYPPTTNLDHGLVPNPYYNATTAVWEPPVMPGTPNPSMPGEGFMDTPIVNGTAYPYMEVEPKAYRFRILNASNDRALNLQLYVAADNQSATTQDAVTDPNALCGAGTTLTPDRCTEVKMIPVKGTAWLPPFDESGVPESSKYNGNDVSTVARGPDWIQIGTEGGFLPTPAVIPSNQPITWNTNPTAFNFGNVNGGSLILGSAERADVVVDFSKYAGQTLILYNDAPAAFPAPDSRYDYFTGDPDRTDTGGAPTTLPGYGPNTRTIMQIRVANSAAAPAYDVAALTGVWAKTSTQGGVFATSQDPIIVPQVAYNSAYNASYTAVPSEKYVMLNSTQKTFTPIDATGTLQTPVTISLEPKALHDEMGGVYDTHYGRMSGMLGLELPASNSQLAQFIAYGYASPPVEIIKGSVQGTMIGSLNDGTQIWDITHNGVDTHTIHVHLFNAQLINRVGWDGAMIAPAPNELGWKETFRVNPLEHTYLALRPLLPNVNQLPFEVPNAIRLIDPTMPEGSPLDAPPPTGWFDPSGTAITQILNHYVNFGWEYVYHCHILAHEEMDMMHATAFVVPPKGPSTLTATLSGNGNNKKVVLKWVDNSKNETGFTVERATNAAGPWTTLVSLPGGATTYTDPIGNTNTTYSYRVVATNTVGDAATAGFPVVTAKSDYSNVAQGVLPPAAPTSMTAVQQAGPQVLLTWRDNATNETGFAIERSVNGGAFAALATAPAKVNSGNNVTYTDTAVTVGTTYAYRVAAVNSTGQSAYSNTATVTIAAVPAAPSNVAAATARQGTQDRVTLSWTDNANNETGYTIQYSTSSTFASNVVTKVVAANTTTFNTGYILPRNTPYYFRVQATNAAGASAWVNATPFPIITAP